MVSKSYSTNRIKFGFGNVSISTGKLTEFDDNNNKTERKVICFGRLSGNHDVGDDLSNTEILPDDLHIAMTFESDESLHVLIKSLLELKKMKLEDST